MGGYNSEEIEKEKLNQQNFIQKYHIDQIKLKTTEGTITKRIMGLGKRAKRSKLIYVLEMEITEVMLLKRKLNFVIRLMVNKFTREVVDCLLKESRQNGLNHTKRQCEILVQKLQYKN
ncbi:hypothetical protein BpHYR1_030416 [Brachionus plicatilis]|uniref:Uncharacterized protein n=1 Tax=Brachionus plicatilis TaxID=10195 RepID=A0A3M7SM88_BRAPC|nr:hypothetical protein BpHYR1_030416 [Brachionus plicatilis]